MTVTQGGRRDAVRNYHRILDAARDVLGESGAEASMEEIATRAGVGVGTVYRRFASKDALIDELVRLAMEEVTAAAERALARADGHGLEDFLRAIGQSFADHARYANLLLERPVDPRATQRLRDAVGELTARAAAAGTVAPGVTQADIMALVRAMRGLVHDAGEVQSWPRFLDIHLAGLQKSKSLSRTSRGACPAQAAREPGVSVWGRADLPGSSRSPFLCLPSSAGPRNDNRGRHRRPGPAARRRSRSASGHARRR